jgi:ABC-2 type transport system ATP-binding protein
LTAVTVSGVSRSFGAVEALRDVTLDVAAGTVTGLLGHNGAGKTTLVRVLTGLLRAHGGSVRTLGLDPIAEGRALRHRVGVLGETPGLDELLTVRENLEVAATLLGISRADVTGRVEEVLEQLGLAEHTDRRVRGLSAGLRQRVALARAIVHEPELLFLDEPATNMDPVASLGVRDLMRRWAHEFGRTVVICTHDLREAAAACDRVVILEHGRVLATGSPSELAVQVPVRPGVRIWVGAAASAAARDTVTSLGMLCTSLDGAVTVDDVRPDDIPALVARLVGAGVPIHAVIPSGPTLEDAYIALHAGRVGS